MPTSWPARSRSSAGLAVPLTVRGAGTSIAGNAVGAGVVLDSRAAPEPGHCRSIPRRGRRSWSPARCSRRLQAAAAPHGLRFGPDPSTHTRATLGGMIGNNACGSRALAYGRTADNVLGLDVLTGPARSARWLAGWAGLDPNAAKGTPMRSSDALQQVSQLVQANLAMIRTEFGRFGRQVSGYSPGAPAAREAAPTWRASWPAPKAPSPSSPAATVRWSPSPLASVLAVLGYPDMAAAADAVPGAAAAQAGRGRGAGRAARGRVPRPTRRRRGAGPARGRGLAVRRDGGLEPRPRLRAASRAADGRTPVPWTPGGHRCRRARQAVAHPRGRGGPVGAAARAASRPRPGWEDAAVPARAARRVPARLRRAAEPSSTWSA